MSEPGRPDTRRAEQQTAPVERASDAKVLIISVAARLAGMHPQTLRQYDRLGLVSPGRTPGGGRRYSERDVVLLREIQRLSQDDGVSLEGIRRIIDLERLVVDLQRRIMDLEMDLADANHRLTQVQSMTAYPGRAVARAYRQQTALVVWRPRRPSNGG
ncbi:MAG TPA: helix-turn-helix transcriptional regulator [Micromonosporaceae bacterium]|nr:helix-turn-helix transcriptional regulator [Micromonosporaceae bacterium]